MIFIYTIEEKRLERLFVKNLKNFELYKEYLGFFSCKVILRNSLIYKDVSGKSGEKSC